MQAVGNFVIVRKDKNPFRTDNLGMEVDINKADRYIPGEIVSVSEHGQKNFGLLEGQTIVFDKSAGFQVRSLQGEVYTVIRCTDVAAVL